jgi:large subunit ribosomal protein L18
MDPQLKQEKRLRRKARVRAKISGTSERPRLCVFKSNKHIYAQLIDDKKGQTLVAASDQDYSPPKVPAKGRKGKRGSEERKSKVAIAFEVGKLIAKKAIENKFEKVVFDKAGYRYQGRVKALAEGAREGGLKF